MKCGHCPREGRCGGEWAARLCQLVDPSHPDHHPEYLASLDPPEDATEPVAYPSLATQAANLAGAAMRFVASGLRAVDRAEFERRRSICLACPTGRYDVAQDRCSACGCYASVKPWGAAEKCPDGHW